MSSAEKLKRIREEKGLSQSDLARKVGLARSTICSYESGRRARLTIPIMKAIADALDVPWNAIFDITSDNLTVYDRIDMILKERRISRRKLARKTGIPESTLASAFVRRPEHFPAKYIQAIAEALDIPLNSLSANMNDLAQEWICVKECLPKKTTDEYGNRIRYLTWAPDYGGFLIARYIPDKKIWESVGIPVKVTHWRSLPEPPKTESNPFGGGVR